MDNFQDLQRLRRLCALAFLEVKHLKKLLIAQGVILQDDLDDYANSLAEYMIDLDLKDKLIAKDFPGFQDRPEDPSE